MKLRVVNHSTSLCMAYIDRNEVVFVLVIALVAHVVRPILHQCVR